MLNPRKYFDQGYRKWLILGKTVVNPRAWPRTRLLSNSKTTLLFQREALNTFVFSEDKVAIIHTVAESIVRDIVGFQLSPTKSFISSFCFESVHRARSYEPS